MNLDGVSWMLLDLIETCLHVQRVRCEVLNSGWAGVALQGLSGLTMCLARRGRKRGGTAQRCVTQAMPERAGPARRKHPCKPGHTSCQASEEQGLRVFCSCGSQWVSEAAQRKAIALTISLQSWQPACVRNKATLPFLPQTNILCANIVRMRFLSAG